MNKKILKFLINKWENIGNELKCAYEETYGDEKLTEEFANKVKQIKFKNEQAYKEGAMMYVMKKVFEENGHIMPPLQAAVIAEEMYKDAKNSGQLDILNNLTEEWKGKNDNGNDNEL